jgi:CRISPR-associated protein Cas1
LLNPHLKFITQCHEPVNFGYNALGACGIEFGRSFRKKNVVSIEIPEKYIFSPKRMDIDSVIIYGQNGNLTLDAIRWLIKHNVQISILNWDGKLLTTMLPPESTNFKTKFAQYHAFEDEKARVKIAKNFIEAKFDKTLVVLDYLKQRYPEIEYDLTEDFEKLEKAKTIKEIMGVEGGVAYKYWNEFSKAVPEKYEFDDRTGNTKHVLMVQKIWLTACLTMAMLSLKLSA